MTMPSVNTADRPFALPGRELIRPDVSNPPFKLPLTEKEARIVAAYKKHGSVCRAGKELGVCGQTVHYWLKKLGYSISPPPEFTSQQEAQILSFYKDTPPDDFDLAAFAAKIGKSKHNVARFARKHGLTKRERPMRSDTIAKVAGKPKWKEKPHPRGMGGKRHKTEARRAISAASKLSWVKYKALNIGCYSEENRQKISERMQKLAAARPASANYSRCRSGRRDDLGPTFFRSSWEANYARYLNLLMKMGVVESWEFEPKTFWFEGVKRGTASYLPDFCVKYKGDPKPEYIEIKGWVVAKDRTKWKRMAKYHPDVKLVIIKEKQYYALASKWASAIPNWETQRKQSHKSRSASLELSA